MRKFIIIVLALLLTGCVTDNTMSMPIQLDPNFKFDEQLVHVEVGRKEIGFGNTVAIHRLLTNSEQAAYLLSGASLFDYYINNIKIDDVELSLNEISPLSNKDVYEVFMHFTLRDNELEKLGETLTSIKIMYKDKIVFYYEHSPVYFNFNANPFELEGGYQEGTKLILKNWTNKDYEIQQIFVEDSNSKRYTIIDKPFLYKNLDEINLPISRQLLVEQQLEGAIAILAVTKDGEEILMNGLPFINEELYEQKIRDFEALISSK